MDRLWAPWRHTYVGDSSTRPTGCVFCAAAEAIAAGDELPTEGPGELVLARGEHVYSILNRYPYNNAHLMMVPYAHVGTLAETPADALCESMAMATRWTQILTVAMGVEGFNLGYNLGAAAGAGLAAHLHLHLVPRWWGDTNFMPAVGGVKVLPEALDTTRDRLRAAWQASE